MAAGAARVHNDGKEWYLFAQLEDVHEGCDFVIDSTNIDTTMGEWRADPDMVADAKKPASSRLFHACARRMIRRPWTSPASC